MQGDATECSLFLDSFSYLCPFNIEKNMTQMDEFIRIKGARVNNLKNVTVDIPRNKLVVVTGVSGSGKSSLAFDTLYSEGQRRYVESLSSYARQFLGRMEKPECDFIEGIPPAIAIEQKVISRNPRSTVGTSTEIYEYLRLLFTRIGKTISPVSGCEVKKHTTDDIVACMLSYGEGTKFLLECPLVVREGRSVERHLEMLMASGYSRIDVRGDIVRIDDFLETEGGCRSLRPDEVSIVIDRMSASADKATIDRLIDSAETAIYEGDGACLLKILPAGIVHQFSTRFEADGMTFEEPNDNMFSFNSPSGACPECEGFGRVIGIDEGLVVPDASLCVYEGAVVCWRGEKMSMWKDEFCRRAADNDFPIFEPYYKLTQKQKDFLWHGAGDVCLDSFFKMLSENQYKIQYRVMLARYRGKTVCPKCHGTRLKPEASYVKVGGRSISDLVDLPVSELRKFFDQLQLTEHDQAVAKRLLIEINSRLKFLSDVGLDYLTMNRLSNTLSGGESQRINLATSLGSSLVGSLYILDEPSIGLHSRDTHRLIGVLKQLRDLGNTVVVVEHEEEIMRAADYIIDIGPDAGRHGGEIVFRGNMADIENGRVTDAEAEASHTVRYLTGRDRIDWPKSHRAWNNYIEVKGARENNLKGVDVRFPLNVMTVVTGVSGSGKSTLVRDIFYNALKRELDECSDKPGQFSSIGGDIRCVKNIEFVDQNPIGRSTRSNPVTYVKAYDEIRKLLASQQLAKQMGFASGFFSFNSEGGRCEECKGEGTVTIEMQFMADIEMECEACHGKRFKNDVLEVKAHGKNAYEILDMTINQAIEFFTEHKEAKIVRKLKPLQDVGLGYVKLGQSSSSLSGGESQRVKLAFYLGQEKADPTIFVFDEPTTGLHFHDIKKLLAAFGALIDRGHTIVVIEHNMDVIKCADNVIDLGPEGGDKGGMIVATGTPEQIADCKDSYTGKFLARLR